MIIKTRHIAMLLTAALSASTPSLVSATEKNAKQSAASEQAVPPEIVARTDFTPEELEIFRQVSESILTAPNRESLAVIRTKIGNDPSQDPNGMLLKSLDVLTTHRHQELDDAAHTQAREPIDNYHLTRFIDKFAAAYDIGDMKQFTNLFAENASSNGNVGRNRIAKEYEQLFSGSLTRRLVLKDLRWQRTKDAAWGQGDFEVTIQRKGEDAVKSYAGKIALDVKQQNGNLAITRLYHTFCELNAF